MRCCTHLHVNRALHRKKEILLLFDLKVTVQQPFPEQIFSPWPLSLQSLNPLSNSSCQFSVLISYFIKIQLIYATRHHSYLTILGFWNYPEPHMPSIRFETPETAGSHHSLFFKRSRWIHRTWFIPSGPQTLSTLYDYQFSDNLYLRCSNCPQNILGCERFLPQTLLVYINIYYSYFRSFTFFFPSSPSPSNMLRIAKRTSKNEGAI